MKNSTTSILLNVLATIIALFAFLGSIGFLFEGQFITALLLFIAALIVSPLTKIVLGKMKRNIIKIIRVVVPFVLFLIASLGMNIDGVQQSEIKNIEVENEESRLTKIKDSLNIILSKKQLSVCKVNNDISSIELQSITDADKKYPEYGIKHNDYTFQLIEKRTESYLKEKRIDSVTFDKISIFIIECSEKERKDRQYKTWLKKKLQKEQSEKVNKCFEASCSILSDRLKESLHNAKSYKYVGCKKIDFKNNVLTIEITYRGENAFGAIRTEIQLFNIDVDNCSLVD